MLLFQTVGKMSFCYIGGRKNAEIFLIINEECINLIVVGAPIDIA